MDLYKNSRNVIKKVSFFCIDILFALNFHFGLEKNGKQQQSHSNGKLHHTIYSFVICCAILCECILIVYFWFFLPAYTLKCFVLDVSGFDIFSLSFLTKYEKCIAQSLLESRKVTSHAQDNRPCIDLGH